MKTNSYKMKPTKKQQLMKHWNITNENDFITKITEWKNNRLDCENQYKSLQQLINECHEEYMLTFELYNTKS